MKYERYQDPLSKKSFALAVRIAKLARYLVEQKQEYVLSKQILRSGTNPGAMVREAQSAESKADFAHKLSIAQKETSETLYWLELLKEIGLLKEEEFKSIYTDTEEVIKLLVSSIKTAKKKGG